MPTPIVALLVNGAELRVEDPQNPGTYLPIPGIRNLRGPQWLNEQLVVTAIDSTVVQRIDGLTDPGEVTAEMTLNLDNARHLQIFNAAANKTPTNYQIGLPDTRGTTWTFPANTGFEFQGDSGAPQIANLRLTVRDAITRAP